MHHARRLDTANLSRDTTQAGPAVRSDSLVERRGFEPAVRHVALIRLRRANPSAFCVALDSGWRLSEQVK